MKRIIIIGGGPSGIVSAIFSKRENNEVIILEKNKKPLKKLLVTGNGKCNYLNEYYDTSCYHSMDEDIIPSILTKENIDRVRNFFDSIGIIPKIKNGYYYPSSNQATTIEKALLKEIEQKNIQIVEEEVLDIEKENDKFIITGKNKMWTGDIVVLGTGSFAYPKTGSDGIGYSFLEKFHHTIIKPLPALVQLVGKGSYFKDWDGVRSDAILSLYENDKFLSKEEGEVQLTSYGISGICTFNLSHYVTRGLDSNYKEEIRINFIPFIKEDISIFLEYYYHKNPYKNMKELLEGFLNDKLVKVILKRSNIKENKYYKDLEIKDKNNLYKYLQNFPVEIISTKDFNSSQICNGGVKLTEINPNTMESLLVPNLYVVGELLDMNGNCGGYNLTLCWISGILSGKNSGDKCD